MEKMETWEYLLYEQTLEISYVRVYLSGLKETGVDCLLCMYVLSGSFLSYGTLNILCLN